MVLQRALERQAVLVTEDKDFGELVFRQRKMNAGIVLYRLPGLSPAEKVLRISQPLQPTLNFSPDASR